jgi:hypothetical protein
MACIGSTWLGVTLHLRDSRRRVVGLSVLSGKVEVEGSSQSLQLGSANKNTRLHEM